MLFYMYKISVDTVLLLCYTRMCVLCVIMCKLLYYYILLQFLQTVTLLPIDNPFEQCHNGNHGKAIKPDHPARQASYRQG